MDKYDFRTREEVAQSCENTGNVWSKNSLWGWNAVWVGRRGVKGAVLGCRSCWTSGPPSCLANHPHACLPSDQGLNTSLVTGLGRGEGHEEKGGSPKRPQP